MSETVNHPAHYNVPGRKECIEEMLEKFGREKLMAFCELNSYKYKYRAEMKNGKEDLEKAFWYEAKLDNLWEIKEDYMKIAEHYGKVEQTHQLIEKMAWLIQVICKERRLHGAGQRPSAEWNPVETVKRMIGELADVQLMLRQVIYLYGIREEVDEEEKAKIKRTMERIQGERS